ncbi:DMT family transporter [Pseudomonas sp. L1(2025)]|uniref:DMT family transporter n=1 Tax=Pseudomonas sp. L1(2025) TaxID=3449429 RepID=UPI003F68C314
MSSVPLIDRKALSVAVFFGLLSALIWGAWPVLSRFGVQKTLSPYDIAALRFMVAGLILLPFVLKKGTGTLGLPKTLVLTLGQGIPHVLLGIIGLAYAPAGHAGVLIPSAMIAVSTVGGWFVLRDRPQKAVLIGVAVVLAGATLSGWRSLTDSGGQVWLGDLLFIGAGALWGVYTLASRAWDVDAFQATALVSVVSMLLYLPLYFIWGTPGILAAPVSEIVFQSLFQGVFAAILGLLFYTKAVTILGATRGSIFGGLVPCIASVLGILVLSEVPSPIEIAGVILASGGMIYVFGFRK